MKSRSLQLLTLNKILFNNLKQLSSKNFSLCLAEFSLIQRNDQQAAQLWLSINYSFDWVEDMLKKFKQDFPKFKLLFQFTQFNQVQKQCFSKIFNYQSNMIVSAPTSSGKTVLFQLLIVKLMSANKTKCLYLAPIKSLCHEKCNSWRKKFLTTMTVKQLTGDTLQMDPKQFDSADIYIATPQKVDYLSRKNLNFLKELNLLLIDEIHMLNIEDRGAILEAIVSRIMSINKQIRIMAVSATIPNIAEVAQWLKVPSHLVCVFGNQYRPAKLNKIVLGFKPANNDFNFQKMLNFKILDVIRKYSLGGGVLIFCQTQKGTEEACSKLISQAIEKQFVENENLSFDLINVSKSVDNTTLKAYLPHGVAFHNAGLSMKDRSIVQGLFLDLKVKVLCTTSTLAMGINLPARLVIIKSTKCYKGSGKGYQQYSQIELEQMMGRAGRVPYDKEGTVVIMTQKSNFAKYAGQMKLQNLQSQLYYQFIDHLNTQISLKSIQNFDQAVEYFKNSFCYIRMQTCPKIYNLSSNKDVEKFVQDACVDCIRKLAQYDIIQYVQSNKKIFPKQCSNNISKNAIEVESIIKIIQKLGQIKTEREYIAVLCKAEQLCRYRSKLDQRKCLKDLNEKIRYSLKQSISTSQKKCFVLVQAQLAGIYIDNWQLRKQAKQMLHFFKRLAYCVKHLAIQRKNNIKTFWLFLFGCLFHKYFTVQFWENNHEKVLRQIKKVNSKWKNITARGIRSLADLVYGLDKLDAFSNSGSSANIKHSIEQELSLLNNSLQINYKKVQDPKKGDSLLLSDNSCNGQGNHLVKFTFTSNFTEAFKSIQIIVEHDGSIYHWGYINTSNLQFSVFLKNTSNQKYFIAVIKEGYVGFDEYYWFEGEQLKKTDLKREENDKKIQKAHGLTPNQQDQSENLQTNSKILLQKVPVQNLSQSFGKQKRKLKNTTKRPRKINYTATQSPGSCRESSESLEKQIDFQDLLTPQIGKPNNFEDSPIFQPSSTLKIDNKFKQLKITENFKTIKRKNVFDEKFNNKQEESNPFQKQMKKMEGYRDLKTYNWRPGFQPIRDYSGGDNTEIYKQQNSLLKASSSFQSTVNKTRKLLLSNEQDSDSQNEKRNANDSDVKVELQKYMYQMISRNSVLKKLNKKHKNQSQLMRKDQTQFLTFDQNQTQKRISSLQEVNFRPSPFKYEYKKQETTDLSKPFIQKLKKKPQKKVPQLYLSQRNQHQFQQNCKLTQNQPRKPFIIESEKHFIPQKYDFSQLKSNKQFQLNFAKQRKSNKKNNVSKKIYKNPFEYFESFLSEEEDELKQDL